MPRLVFHEDRSDDFLVALLGLTIPGIVIFTGLLRWEAGIFLQPLFIIAVIWFIGGVVYLLRHRATEFIVTDHTFTINRWFSVKTVDLSRLTRARNYLPPAAYGSSFWYLADADDNHVRFKIDDLKKADREQLMKALQPYIYVDSVDRRGAQVHGDHRF